MQVELLGTSELQCGRSCEDHMVYGYQLEVGSGVCFVKEQFA
jgi:hypothetical protein